jgi:hypothetical protein
MTNILFALVDGSTYSKSVCDHAAWAAAHGCRVDLMHVLDRQPGAGKSDLSGSIALGARTALLEELSSLDEQRAKLLSQKGRAILDDARAIIEAAGQKVVGAHLRMGEIVDTVIEQEGPASMIMIGKRGEEADFASLRLGPISSASSAPATSRSSSPPAPSSRSTRQSWPMTAAPRASAWSTTSPATSCSQA